MRRFSVAIPMTSTGWLETICASVRVPSRRRLRSMLLSSMPAGRGSFTVLIAMKLAWCETPASVERRGPVDRSQPVKMPGEHAPAERRAPRIGDELLACRTTAE